MLEIDRADVVAEVTAVFERYEDALLGDDRHTVDGFFWTDARTVRYGIVESLHGHDAIVEWRRTAAPVPARRLEGTRILALGPDVAVVDTGFVDVSGVRGRQSQTWARLDGGWRIVSAHVSHPKAG